MAQRRTAVELDDIIFQLQPFGGITEYWTEVTARLVGMPHLDVTRVPGTRWRRLLRRTTKNCVSHSSYFRLARGPRVLNVITVHDMAYELGHVRNGLPGWVSRMERRRAYLGAQGIVCISEATKRDLLALFPGLLDRALVRVVHHGVGLAPPVVPRSRLAPLGPHGDVPYVLYVGGRGHYKNFGAALHGFKASGLPGQGYRLLCTGSPLTASELQSVGRLGMSNSVFAVGTVSRDELHSLYVHAAALLYASLFEGFGLPVLEAMRAGCPVVASNTSALPEVAGDAALLVDACNPAEIGRALVNCLDVERRRVLVSRGYQRIAEFSWDRSAQAHVRLYQELSATAC